QMLNALLKQFGQMPNIPPGFLPKFKELAQKDDFISRVVPVYLKFLDEKDLDGAITFYKSPAGRNFIKAQPQIIDDSMAIGQAWGQDLATRTLQAIGQTPGGNKPAP